MPSNPETAKAKPGKLLRTIIAPWAFPKTVTADEWCAAVDDFFNRADGKSCSGSD
jgi:hypothetical protein